MCVCKNCLSLFADSLKRMSFNKPKSCKCRECNKEFSIVSCLKTHMLSHSLSDDFNLDSKEEINLTLQQEHVAKSISEGSLGATGDATSFGRYNDNNVYAGTESHICKECGRVFKSRSRFEVHNENHSKDTPFTCRICLKVFSSSVNFRAHMKKHTEKDLYECLVCHKKFLQKPSLQVHEKLHIARAPFPCEMCSAGFYSQSSLNQHNLFHGEVRPLACKVCKKSFACQNTLKKHSLLHSNKRSLSCNTCGKIFRLKKYLDQHMRIHAAIRPYSCSSCDKKFVHRAHLQVHLKVHSGEKPFGCSNCSKRFYTKGALNAHELIHLKERPYQCQLCKRRFVQRAHLKTHMVTHSGEKPFTCDVCGQAFAWRRILEVHTKLKHGADSSSSYECVECKKKIVDKDSYEYHNHQPSRRQSTCKLCTKDFTRYACLKEHVQHSHAGKYICTIDINDPNSYKNRLVLHKDEKPHTCTVCGKNFKLLSILKKHILIHTNNKNNVCSICRQCFRQASHLKTHMSIHTGAQPYKCDICGRSFSQNGNLKVHKKIHDRDKMLNSLMTVNTCEVQEVMGQEIVSTKPKVQNCFLGADLLNTKKKQDYYPLTLECDKIACKSKIEDGSSNCTCRCMESVIAESFGEVSYKSFQEIVLDNAVKTSSVKFSSEELVIFDKISKLMDKDPLEITNVDNLVSTSDSKGSDTVYECTLVVGRDIESFSRIENKISDKEILLKYPLELNAEDISLSVDETPDAMLSNEWFKRNDGLPDDSEKINQRLEHMREVVTKGLSSETSQPMYIASKWQLDKCKPELERNLNIQLEFCEGSGENLFPHLQVSDEAEESIQAFVLPSEEPELGVVTVNQVDAKRHSCTLCNKSYTEKSSLNVHMRAHTGVKPYVCNYCNKAFALITSYKTHLRSHTGERPYQCKFCQKGFSQIANYKAHLVTHKDERPFKCLVCGEDFKLNWVLKRHMLIHNTCNSKMLQKREKVKVHVCKHCNKAFDQRKQLDNHLLIHTVKQIFSCPKCHKIFSLESSFKTHLHSHFEQKPPKCSNCSKSFTSLSSLKDHMVAAHGDIHSYRCDVCYKIFQRGSSYRLHMKRHTGEKPFSCTVCSKQFFLKVTLQQHMMIHTNEKPHQCKICNKSFRQSTHLKMHQVTHTGDKHFKCIVCSKTFSVKASLKQHMRIHTGELKYSCEVCNKGFTHLSSYKFHLKKH